jgi:hypothetical protein
MTDTTPTPSVAEALLANAKPLVGGGVMTFILVTKPQDGAGVALFGGLALLFFALAAWRIRKALRPAEGATVIEAADGLSHLPPDEQVAKVRRLRLIALGATWAFGAWAYVRLSAFERGDVAPERLWAPIAFLYNWLGLWPAVLVLPLVGVIVWIAGGKMIERAESPRSGGDHQ